MVLFHLGYYKNIQDCQAFDTDGAVCKYQSQNNVHKPQTHMTSRADLKRLVKKGFIARTLINAFGGTIYRQKGYIGDTDFIIQLKDGLPGVYIKSVLAHEFEGNLGCKMHPISESKDWGRKLTVVEIYIGESTAPVMRMTVSTDYPYRMANGTISSRSSMRISVRLTK